MRYASVRTERWSVSRVVPDRLVSFRPLLQRFRNGCDIVERVDMGDKYRYRNDTNRLRHFQLVLMFFFFGGVSFHERRRPSLQTSARQMSRSRVQAF